MDQFPLNLISTYVLRVFPCQQPISENKDATESTKMNSHANLENVYIFKSPSQSIPAGGKKEVPNGQPLHTLQQQYMGLEGEKLHSLPLLANVNSFAESLNTICLEIQNFLLHSGAARGKCTVLSAKP